MFILEINTLGCNSDNIHTDFRLNNNFRRVECHIKNLCRKLIRSSQYHFKYVSDIFKMVFIGTLKSKVV